MRSLKRLPMVTLAVVMLLSSAALLAAVSPAAHAASASCSGTSYTWTGESGGTSWTDSGNWAPKKDYPGYCASDSATITPLPTQAFVIINLPSSFTLNALTLTRKSGTSGGGVEIAGAGSLTISGSFNWSVNGSVSTPLTVEDTATIIGDSQNGTSLIESEFKFAGTTRVSGTGLALIRQPYFVTWQDVEGAQSEATVRISRVSAC